MTTTTTTTTTTTATPRVLLAVVALSAMGAASSRAASTVQLSPCTLSGDGVPAVRGSCGTVQVRADRASGATAKLLPIAVAVLPTLGEKPRPDPVVFLAGGPGQAATDVAAVLAPAFDEVRRDRDVIFIDVRGTGRSTRLACADARPLAERLRASDEDNAAVIAACAQRALPIDPKTVTTEQLARDLDDVRSAFGVDSWNIVGISYGTRLALAYDRLFPGKARALVLDGVVPFEMNIGEKSGDDAEAALRAVDERCKRAPLCPKEPTLRQMAAVLLERLRRSPEEVVLRHPRTGAPLTLVVDERAAASAIIGMLYTEEGDAILGPVLRAARAGDLAPLAAQLAIAETLHDSIADGMQLSILCAEDVPFYQRPASFLGVDVTGGIKPVCAAWPHAQVSASFHESKLSPTPALLLSGGADPVTPPSYADLARRHLSRCVHVVGEGIGHNVLVRGCAPKFLRAFLDDPRPEALDTSCKAKLAPFPLFIDTTGPAP